MGRDQPIEPQIENSVDSRKEDAPKQNRSDGGENSWRFPFLMMILGLGVLMLILKCLGVV